MMQRENKKRGREVAEDKTTSEKCAKKMHKKNTDKNTRPDHHRELDEVVELSVFDFPWIKDGTMFSTISEDDWYFEGTFLSSLRAAIEDQGEFFSQFSSCSAGGFLEFLPEIADGDNRPIGDESSSILNVENNADQCIWASVLNQPLGRV